MFQLLIHKESQRSMMYDKKSNVPEGVIPNVMSQATPNTNIKMKSEQFLGQEVVSRVIDSNENNKLHFKCDEYILDSNIFATDVGDIVIDSIENNTFHFNVSNVFSNVFVYGQKVPDTHVLVDLPEEFNDAPETADFTREQNGTYTFTLNTETVKGRIRMLLQDMITERNKQLTASDWTQMPDSPIPDEEKQMWHTYRQALRDFPSTYTGGPNDWQASFPTKP